MKDFDKGSFGGEEKVGRTLEESIEIAKLLESYGYDALSVMYRNWRNRLSRTGRWMAL